MPNRRAFIVYPPGGTYPSNISILLRETCLFEVRVVGGATRREIVEGLEWLAAGAVAGDTLLFFYQGPGSDPLRSSSVQDIEGWVQEFVPSDVDTVGYIDHHMIHQILIAPLPEGVRVLNVVDTYHDGSLFELKHAVSIEAIRLSSAPALPVAIGDREYDNREWDVSVHIKRRSMYWEPKAQIVTMAPGRFNDSTTEIIDTQNEQTYKIVSLVFQALEDVCSENPSLFAKTPLIVICKQVAAELQMSREDSKSRLILSCSNKPLSALISYLD